VATLFKALVGCVALAAMPAWAQGDHAAPAWQGVWLGTVGSAPVHVCLEADPDGKGAYYYDRVKRLLRLVPGKAGGEWFEQEQYYKNGARWRIAASDGALTGTWGDGKKELPVRLTRVAVVPGDESGPCGSLAFNRPRVGQVRLTARRATEDGEPYTLLTFKPGSWFGDNVEIVTFALDRPGARIAAVNALLRAALPKPDGTGDWFDCVSGSVDNSGMDGSYDKAIEPTMISARWLSVSDHGNDYCGGPHPESFITSRNFDLVRGIEIDPLDWFGPKAVHREDLGGTYGIYKTLTPAFRAMILKGWKGEKDADCDDAMRNQEDWTVGIARGALVFTPQFAHVIMACTEDFKIPFARLRPWLNDQGNAALPTLPS
jgi:hypothetical protein